MKLGNDMHDVIEVRLRLLTTAVHEVIGLISAEEGDLREIKLWLVSLAALDNLLDHSWGAH